VTVSPIGQRDSFRVGVLVTCAIKSDIIHISILTQIFICRKYRSMIPP